MNEKNIEFIRLTGNYIDNRFETRNFFVATLYCILKCPRFLNKLWVIDSNCKIRYQTDGTSFGEQFVEVLDE